jgi:hypothetical protein
MAVLNLQIGDATRILDTDDLTLGFFEDLETYQESKKTKDLITTLIALLSLDRDQARQVTMRQWLDMAQTIGQAATVPPTSA